MNKSLSMVKCIAALFVILIHVISFNTEKYVCVINALIRCAVPIFALISGYFSFFNDKNVNIEEKYKTRINKMLKLIILSILFYLAFRIYNNQLNMGKILKIYNFKNIFKLIILNISQIAGHLWYIYALLYCYIILFITNRLNIKIESLYKYIPILLIINLLLGEISYILDIKIASIYSRNFLFMILPFFLVGHYINRNSLHEKIHTKSLIIAILISILLTIVERLATKQFDTYIGTIILSTSIFLLCIKHPGGMNLKITEWIGANLTNGIYIIHLAVLQTVEKIEKVNGINPIEKWYINVFVIFVISIFIAGLIYLLKKFTKRGGIKWKKYL